MKSNHLRALLKTLREGGVSSYSDGTLTISLHPEIPTAIVGEVREPRPPPATPEEARQRSLDDLRSALFRDDGAVG